MGSCDGARFKPVIDELHNDFGKGKKVNYPGDIAGVVTMLSNRRGTKDGSNADDIKDGIVTSFAQGAEEHGHGPRCYKCQEYGHFARDCPLKKKNQKKNGAGVSTFQWNGESDDDSSYSSAQDRADEWNNYWFHG